MSYAATMKPLLGAGILLVGIGLAYPGRAEVRLPADSPFQVILIRNPFGLRPVPTNVVVVTQTSAPPAQENVNLSGITYVGGKKRAWMVIPAGGPRTNTATFSMAVGDPEFEGVKVEHIDVRRGVVQIRKQGVPTTLDFENHGLAYSGPVAVTVPGAAGRPGRVPVPGQPRPGVPTPNAAVRAGVPGSVPSASVNRTGGNVPGGNNSQVIPARAIRTSPEVDVEQPVDPATQALQMKLQEIRARQSGIPFPPMPPVSGLVDDGGGEGGE
jgi:hypothetical protein